VEDEPNLLYILNRLLQADRHIVTATTSGEEAIRLFSTRPDDFDLVLSDLSIADSSGWDVAQAVKNLRPATPIALVTGWGAELEAEMLRIYGISEVINKPYRLNEVRTTINRMVERAGLPQN
jgi:CheY-like chemotaxis protein